VNGIVTDGTTLYFTTTSDDQIQRLLPDGGPAGLPLDVWSRASGDPRGTIAFDNGYVYWATPIAQGSIKRWNVMTHTTQVLAAMQAFASGFAFDSNAIYWVNRGTSPDGVTFNAADGAVMKLAKP
jgi:hypothetical protein